MLVKFYKKTLHQDFEEKRVLDGSLFGDSTWDWLKRDAREKARNFEWMINNDYLKPPKLRHVFFWNFEVWAVQRYTHLVGLRKCWNVFDWVLVSGCNTSVSIQQRTSLSKFGVIYSVYIQSPPHIFIQLACVLSLSHGRPCVLLSPGATNAGRVRAPGFRWECSAEGYFSAFVH